MGAHNVMLKSSVGAQCWITNYGAQNIGAYKVGITVKLSS